MKKILSVRPALPAFNLGMFILRVMLGIMMMQHGYAKLIKYQDLKTGFMSFMGMSPAISVSLIIFAEFICGFFLVIGLFTRFAVIPIIIGMIVAAFIAMEADFFGKAELPVFYLTAAVVVLLCGPGRISVDGMIVKK